MKLRELSRQELRARLHGDGLRVRTGPFNFRLQSPIESVADGLALLYGESPLSDDADFIDFTVTMARGTGLRRWIKPQARFVYDGESPFEPLPEDHAYPLLEWSMNWCISTQAHQYLLLHAAVIERHGFAAILPAPPGSGKSTLCAGLIHRGWRLLSDELALIDPATLSITPLARPVSLKNESLQVIRAFEPSAVLNQETRETTKGTVTHMRVPAEHLARLDETAQPRWVIFPRFVAGSDADLRPRPKADSMLELARNGFNYSLLGRTAFDALAGVIDTSDCYEFSYSRLDDAVAVFDRLAADSQS
ncbi:HprK-related kinase A [Ideonella sp. A 288]|uniref:HprK-related kinase A n=1 Tax=Ideonella sp. A 288 TaxID=1962181 RepID=UPI000B4C02E6|nr:HprK-related kinase A [Ideonella sp. A 288]